MSQKLSLLARFFFRSSVEQIGVHLRLEQRHARPVGFVDVLRRLGIELERGEDDDLRLGHQRLRFFDRQLDLPLLQRRMLRAERDHDALRLAEILPGLLLDRAFVIRLRLGFGMQPARAGQRLDAGEIECICPPLPRMPVFRSSSRHSACRKSLTATGRPIHPAGCVVS